MKSTLALLFAIVCFEVYSATTVPVKYMQVRTNGAIETPTNFFEANGILKSVKPDAKGDGITDDTAAIQAAITAASTKGGIVKFPPGTYLISSSVVMSNNVHLEGESTQANPTAGSIIRLADGADCDMIRFPAGAWNSTLRGFYLDGNRTNQTVTNIAGIKLENTTADSDRSMVENVFIKAVAGYGIYTTRREVTYRDIKIVHCTQNGIYAQDSFDSTWWNVATGWCDGNGIEIRNCQDVWYYVEAYNHGGHGIMIDRASGNIFYRPMVDANGKHGVLFTVTTTSHYCKDNTIFGGIISCNSQSQDNTYSNVALEGAGTGSFVIDTTFIGVRFWTDVVDMDDTAKWPKYLIDDSRTYTGHIAGARLRFIGCSFISGASPLNTKHFSTAMTTANLFNLATVMGSYDYYMGADLDQSFSSNIDMQTGKAIYWNGANTHGLRGDNANEIMEVLTQQLVVGPNTVATNSLSRAIKAPESTGEDVAGSPLNIIGGRSTGNQNGGAVQFYVSGAGSSGSTQNTNTIRAKIQTDRLQLGSGVALNFNDTASILTGEGSPEGAQIAAPGSLYLNTSGGAGTTIWVKESGTTNTGWVAK